MWLCLYWSEYQVCKDPPVWTVRSSVRDKCYLKTFLLLFHYLELTIWCGFNHLDRAENNVVIEWLILVILSYWRKENAAHEEGCAKIDPLLVNKSIRLFNEQCLFMHRSIEFAVKEKRCVILIFTDCTDCSRCFFTMKLLSQKPRFKNNIYQAFTLSSTVLQQ